MVKEEEVKPTPGCCHTALTDGVNTCKQGKSMDIGSIIWKSYRPGTGEI